VEKQIE
jgi:hypothetical protein